MAEQATYIFPVRDLARRIVTTDTSIACQPGYHIFNSQCDLEIARRKITIYSSKVEDVATIKANQKDYLLGAQCFNELLQLLAADDSLITDLGITDEELRLNLRKGADFKTERLIERLQLLTEQSAGKHPKIVPEEYKIGVGRIGYELLDLNKLKRDLFITQSSLPKA